MFTRTTGDPTLTSAHNKYWALILSIVVTLSITVVVVTAMQRRSRGNVLTFESASTKGLPATANPRATAKFGGFPINPLSRSGDHIEHLSEAFDTMSGANVTDPQASSTPVVINFDDVPAGTNVETRYANIRFSSAPGLHVYTYHSTCCDTPVSQPNTIIPAGNYFAGDFHAEQNMTIDFPTPVNDLRFYICDSDNYFTIGWIDVFQNGVKTQTYSIGGTGPSHQPILADFQQAGLNNITRVSRTPGELLTCASLT
jgi:hypothetical protein